jgi:hypothetical protein
MKTLANADNASRSIAAMPGAPRGKVAPLAPLLAGARARGVADGLELIGAAAALLGEEGEVLHVNARALRLLGGDLLLTGRRLRARNRAADLTLSAAIHSTLRDQVASGVSLSGGNETDGFRVRIMPVAAESDDSFQLLRAVAIFEPGVAAARASLAALN